MMSQPVDSKTVTGRRELDLATIDEVLADAENLASGPYRQLGNWSLGEMCDHLARSLDSTTDDHQFNPPLWMKMFTRLMRKRFIGRPVPAGFKMLSKMEPIFMPTSGMDTQAGLERLRHSVERFKAGPLPDKSIAFGKMSHDDWHQFHCRHAEMHLSFLVPEST